MTTTDLARRTEELERLGDFQRHMKRLDAQARALAASSLLPRSLTHKGTGARPKDEVVADVMAIVLTADQMGVPITLNLFSQFAVISGAVVPSTQMLIGIAARQGIDIWLDESTEARAVACLRSLHGREHRVEYTIEMARSSGALDYWFERWESGSDGRRHLAEKVVVGQSAEEAAAAKRAPWAKGEPKCNPAWHTFRADMLAWRALRRVLKRGAPHVAAGLAAFGDAPVMGVDPSGEAPYIDVDEDGEIVGPEIATDPVSHEPELASDEEVELLRRSIKRLDKTTRTALASEWRALDLADLRGPFPAADLHSALLLVTRYQLSAGPSPSPAGTDGEGRTPTPSPSTTDDEEG